MHINLSHAYWETRTLRGRNGIDKQCEVDHESLASPLYDAEMDFRGSEEASSCPPSTDVHHGYQSGRSLFTLPVKLAERFSKHYLTPSLSGPP
jgi:hypothetical protein